MYYRQALTERGESGLLPARKQIKNRIRKK